MTNQDANPQGSSEVPVENDDCPLNFLARLDAQQNQVMQDLDSLNEQIETLLRQCSEQRSSSDAKAA